MMNTEIRVYDGYVTYELTGVDERIAWVRPVEEDPLKVAVSRYKYGLNRNMHRYIRGLINSRRGR